MVTRNHGLPFTEADRREVPADFVAPRRKRRKTVKLARIAANAPPPPQTPVVLADQDFIKLAELILDEVMGDDHE